MSVATHNGYHYIVTFTDDLSRYGYIYLMKHKSQNFEKFKEFQIEVENQEFEMHLKACGIVPQHMPAGTP
jgi:hypothetical protein